VVLGHFANEECVKRTQKIKIPTKDLVSVIFVNNDAHLILGIHREMRVASWVRDNHPPCKKFLDVLFTKKIDTSLR
jgi:hypothetical protein